MPIAVLWGLGIEHLDPDGYPQGSVVARVCPDAQCTPWTYALPPSHMPSRAFHKRHVFLSFPRALLPQGCLSMTCSSSMLISETGAAMAGISEKLGDALGWAPTLSVMGGPELGNMVGTTADWANFTCSAIIFSDQRAAEGADKAPRARRAIAV